MSNESFLSRLLRGGFREQETRLQVDWMTHTDERIMEHLEANGSTTPSGIATTLEKSEEYVADRCRQLAIRDLLENDGRSYGLAARGTAYLAGEIGAEELSADNGS
ncbi:MAG: phage repressor protein [Euryarchaeota archaeon]|nr:phage repressor protein [Euryarchaeota archaeon]